ncbi:MAG: hypothetical protein LC808_16065 [Actinobacteria bacterium]|nr:hypothetical protein [Actinomycetota bacterium]
MLAASSWTSLEIAKLTVASLVPILLFVLSLVVARTGRRVEDLQWSNRKVTEKRLQIYDELAPPLNDIFCFFLTVGHFAGVAPPEVIARKRESDRIFYRNAALFTRQFQERYADFINACFEHFTGVGKPALLRTSRERQVAERGGEWDPSWDSMFSNQPSRPEDVATTYDALMDSFAEEVGVRRPERRPRPWLTRLAGEGS